MLRPSIDPSLCPLCGSANRCAMERERAARARRNVEAYQRRLTYWRGRSAAKREEYRARAAGAIPEMGVHAAFAAGLVCLPQPNALLPRGSIQSRIRPLHKFRNNFPD